jgi:hypothetical protein
MLQVSSYSMELFVVVVAVAAEVLLICQKLQNNTRQSVNTRHHTSKEQSVFISLIDPRRAETLIERADVRYHLGTPQQLEAAVRDYTAALKLKQAAGRGEPCERCVARTSRR